MKDIGLTDQNCSDGSEGSLRYVSFCLDVLRVRKLRITKARRITIAIMARQSSPCSPQDILYCAQRDGTPMDLVTVYRILEKFESLDLVHQVRGSGTYLPCLHFDCQESRHVMVICKSCGSAQEQFVPSEIILPLVNFLQKNLGFLPENHVFEIDGRCVLCSTQSGNNTLSKIH